MFPLGLIKLNKTIKSASYVRPAKIATSIESQAGGERVVGVGAGRFSLTKSDVDGIVRYAEFVTMPIKECAEQFKTPFDMASTVCAKTVNGTSMFLGDSGRKPLVCSENYYQKKFPNEGISRLEMPKMHA